VAGAACPTDTVASATTICRPVADCDEAESCSGLADQSCPPDDGPLVCDVCEDGKPAALIVQYTGLGSAPVSEGGGTDNSQDGNELVLIGDADDQSPAFIVVLDHRDRRIFPPDGSEETVEVGDLLTISGTKRRIPPRIRFEIYDSFETWNTGGDALEISQFHTSCSQPLFVGDGFGSILISGEE
jgi:hypothetical protein